MDPSGSEAENNVFAGALRRARDADREAAITRKTTEWSTREVRERSLSTGATTLARAGAQMAAALGGEAVPARAFIRWTPKKHLRTHRFQIELAGWPLFYDDWVLLVDGRVVALCQQVGHQEEAREGVNFRWNEGGVQLLRTKRELRAGRWQSTVIGEGPVLPVDGLDDFPAIADALCAEGGFKMTPVPIHFATELSNGKFRIEPVSGLVATPGGGLHIVKASHSSISGSTDFEWLPVVDWLQSRAVHLMRHGFEVGPVDSGWESAV